VAEAVRAHLREIDPAIPVRIEAMTERIRESLVTEWALAAISDFLGGLALLLASAGLYGLISYAVSRRTNEIGIRMALGARQRAVLWMVLAQSLALAGAGLAIGLGASLALGRYAKNLLHGLAPTDPLAMVLASALMLAVGTLAGYLPARRASRVDPLIALREE
jgi:ABC-type antimicrobial peptide transport system permease subunit